MYQQSTSAQTGFQNQQQCPIPDKDMANIVLAELKRMTIEYATASLEANSAKIRHTFEQSLQHTLRDHAELYHFMSQSGMYGQPATANPGEIQKEQQKTQQTSQELQFFIQQYIGGTSSSTSFGSQPMPYQPVQQQPIQFQQQLQQYQQPSTQYQQQPQHQSMQPQSQQRMIGMSSPQTYLNQAVTGYSFQGANPSQGTRQFSSGSSKMPVNKFV